MTDTRALAAYVVLRSPDEYAAGHCAAWMDGPDKPCMKPCEGILCPRHERVAQRRMEKDRAKRAAQRERARTEALADLPRFIRERDRLIEKREQVTGMRRHDTDDLAAYGGIGIRQTPRQRRQYAARVDNALSEYARLTRRIDDLEHRIARAREANA